MAIAERMPGKTNQQISDKRKSLKSQVTGKAKSFSLPFNTLFLTGYSFSIPKVRMLEPFVLG
jgi:hypothetical protein